MFYLFLAITAAQADVGPVTGGSTVGDSGTATMAPTWTPNVSSGMLDLSTPNAGTYVPNGSPIYGVSPQARDGVDSLGGFDGTRTPPGITGGEGENGLSGPSELNPPAPGALPGKGTENPGGGTMGISGGKL